MVTRRGLHKSLFSLVILIMSNREAAAQVPLLADVTVNYRQYGTTLLLTDEQDNYFAGISDLRKWGVSGPYLDVVEYEDGEFVRLRSLGDVAIAYDAKTVSLRLEFPPELLPAQQTSLARHSADPVSSTGAYIDYDWSYTSADESYATGFLAPSVFTPSGVFNAQVLYQGYEPPPDRTTGLVSDTEDWIRLDTTFTRDFPDRMRSLRIGDVIHRPGPWGNALRVGGVQVASNFATQPSFISFPMPNLQGTASMPSTLDLYVDGTLRHRQNLEPGPFRVDEIPVVTGAGQIQMVVTDILGNQHLHAQNFYASQELLRPGLSEYSYTLGSLRSDFGIASNNYDGSALLAEHRYGINNELTMGGRAELGRRTKQISAALDWSPDLSGVISLGLGVSRHNSKSGGAWLLGYRYRARRYNFSARASGSSKHFGVIGVLNQSFVPKTQVVVSGGWRSGGAGSFGAALVHTDYHDRPARDILTLSHSYRLFRRYSLSTSASYTKEQVSDFNIGMTVTTTFGARRSASARVSHDDAGGQLRMETQSVLPTGPGIGYRIGTTVAEQERIDARFIGQTDFGRYTLEGDRFAGNTSLRTSAGGSIAWLAGRPYFAREINDGFAVARVSGLENVRIYVENQEIGRSDKHGRLLLPRLRPYETNRIRIEPTDLPLASEVPTVSMEVTPAFRSGLVVNFPVTTPSFAMLRAVLPSGEALPEGAIVYLSGKNESSIVGLNGAIYLSGPEGAGEVTVEWAGQRCSFDVALPSPTQALPRLGEFVCGAVP